MRYFPIFLDLKAKRVAVIGGGEEALRKVRLIAKTEARIDIIAESLHPELLALWRAGKASWILDAFEPVMLTGAALVYSADALRNEQVSRAAQALGIPVNAVDEAEISTFIVPSIVDRDPVVVAIGTEGTAPVLAQGIRAKVDALLPQAIGKLASAAQSLRARVADEVPHGNRRRGFWQTFFFGAPSQAFLSGDQPRFLKEVERGILGEAKPAAGRVSLVGAGPGDPELLTLKAHRRLQDADVIVHDRLVGPGILEMARRDAIRISVGKTPFESSPKQAEINRILISEAKKGLHVVRLKGGDPYVFGRGGEEQAALEAEGIPVDIVPGITAALGCAAAIGLPLTQRGQNRAFTILTGAAEDGLASQDWTALAKPGQAFAIYMGVSAAGDIAAKLLDAGIAPSTPVTVVENGTLETEREIETSIGALWETLAVKGVGGPAIIYVGLTRAKVSADIVPFPVRDDLRDDILRRAS